MTTRTAGENGIVAAAILIGLGTLLVIIHGVHGAEEISKNLRAVLHGTIVPLGVAIFIIFTGVWAARQRWRAMSPWRFLGWTIMGLGMAILLTILLMLYQAAEGTRLDDATFVVAMFATYGAAIGVMLGWYDRRAKLAQLELRRRNEQLDEFTAIVSHDLRNPLNVIGGYLELAREEVEVEQLNRAESAVDRMDRLITDLLTLARHGTSPGEPERVALDAIASRCWRNIRTEGATLECEADQDIQADPDRLAQLLENLFSNAIDHGGADVTVTIGALPDGFYVEDTGRGIPPERREAVFEAGVTTKETGTGLGLKIVADVAAEHGWTVSVTEGTAGGARFEIRNVELLD